MLHISFVYFSFEVFSTTNMATRPMVSWGKQSDANLMFEVFIWIPPPCVVWLAEGQMPCFLPVLRSYWEGWSWTRTTTLSCWTRSWHPWGWDGLSYPRLTITYPEVGAPWCRWRACSAVRGAGRCLPLSLTVLSWVWCTQPCRANNRTERRSGGPGLRCCCSWPTSRSMSCVEVISSATHESHAATLELINATAPDERD